MKKFLLGSVALAAMIAGPAMAADMPVKYKAPPPLVVYDWSGAYLGFSIGGVWSDVHRFYPNAAGLGPYNTTSHGDDTIYDFHAGLQQQWGSWVLGIEAGLSAGFNEMRSTVADTTPPAVAGLISQNKITNLFTVGPRLGFAWDRWMVYGTGGWASANLKGQYLLNNVQAFQNFAGQSRNDGWFAGGGLEYMLFKGPLVDVVVGAEYQHFDVRGRRAFTDATGFNAFDIDAKGDIVRARLTIKTQGYGFLWAGPVVANY